MTSRAAQICLLAWIVAGCGHQTPVRPPEDVVPRAIEQLTAGRTGTAVRLRWERPLTAVDGQRLSDLGEFEVWRRATGGDAGFRRVAVITVDDRERFQQAKSFEFVDNPPPSGHGYQYYVVALTTEGERSQPSNIVSVDIDASHGGVSP